MSIDTKPENTTKTNEARPSLGKAGHPYEGTREHVEDVLEGIRNYNITTTIKALNGIKRGAYFVRIKQDAEYNEITVKLYDSLSGQQIATGFIDRGHDQDSRAAAAEELRGLVRAYLCR